MEPADPVLLESPVLRAAWDTLRPSEYTAALIQALLGRPATVAGARVLEIGSGSGVILAALSRLHPAALCGVDTEEAAIEAGEALMRHLGVSAEFFRGELWAPVEGRRFDLIISNLPHFPTEAERFPGRLPSWSRGGQNGRRYLDPFLAGLSAHLAPTGRAVIAHNAFVGLDQTRRQLAQAGFAATILSTTLLALPEYKLAAMSPSVRAREDGRTIFSFGSHSFAEMHILDIARSESV